MPKHYVAVTYDLCKHNDFCVDMNEYILDASVDMEKQVRKFAKKDVASLVKVYESDTNDIEVLKNFWELKMYKEYTFNEYECGCEK